MNDRTIHNPVTGECGTFVETSRESGGLRTIIEMEVAPGGGVPTHRHATHDEHLEVLEGELEVRIDGVSHRLGPGGHVVIPRGKTHSWSNPSADQVLRFRGMMTPGHPGFELFLRVWFGLARDGELGKNKLPRRFGDLALLTEWDPSILSGPRRLLAPLMNWSARRARARGRADELLHRYGGDDPASPEARP